MLAMNPCLTAQRDLPAPGAAAEESPTYNVNQACRGGQHAATPRIRCVGPKARRERVWEPLQVAFIDLSNVVQPDYTASSGRSVARWLEHCEGDLKRP